MRHPHNTRALGATAALLALALAGCSSGGSTDQASTAVGRAPAAPMQGQAQADAAQEKAPGAEAPGAQAPDLSVDQRSIIYTGSITVRVKNVNATAAQVAAFATGVGGFVGGDNRHSGPDGSGGDNASLTLRVPSAKFAALVDQIAGLGTEQQRSTNTEDVTEQVVDLDARISTQQARVDSGRRLLAQAKTLNDLVMLEREVATRESDLASLQAKKRHLADLTALSTITAELLGPEAAVAKPEGTPGFFSGLKGGWHALVASLAVLLTVLGALLPWLLALGIPAFAAFWLIRRYGRRSRPAPSTAAPAMATASAATPSTATPVATAGPVAEAAKPPAKPASGPTDGPQ
ncbi:hypothetical protein KRMM14A1259_35320 [Krasilnikovia sp. MM14-A1259]